MGKLSNLGSPLSTLAPLIKAPPKIVDSIYTSPQWRKFIASLKRERGNFCQRCGSKHRVIGDHINEIRDGGVPFDPNNIELLCQACHNRKTALARKRRARGEIEGGGSKV